MASGASAGNKPGRHTYVRIGHAARRARACLLTLTLASAACATRVTPAPDDGAANGTLMLQQRAAELCCRQQPDCQLPPHPFTSDGCTLWPDGNWNDCCIEHDIAYWCGGSAAARSRADSSLRGCVAARSSPFNGDLLHLGVRLGGHPWLPFPWRWGYGWDWPYVYDPEAR